MTFFRYRIELALLNHSNSGLNRACRILNCSLRYLHRCNYRIYTRGMFWLNKLFLCKSSMLCNIIICWKSFLCWMVFIFLNFAYWIELAWKKYLSGQPESSYPIFLRNLVFCPSNFYRLTLDSSGCSYSSYQYLFFVIYLLWINFFSDQKPENYFWLPIILSTSKLETNPYSFDVNK